MYVCMYVDTAYLRRRAKGKLGAGILVHLDDGLPFQPLLDDLQAELLHVGPYPGLEAVVDPGRSQVHAAATRRQRDAPDLAADSVAGFDDDS